MRNLISSLIIFWVAGIFVGSSASARVWLVPSEAPTIQAGIDSASVGDIIEISCGTYYEYDIALKSGITLRSATEQPDCVTVDAQQLGHVMASQQDDSINLIGLTFTNGLSWSPIPSIGAYGAGLLCNRSSISVTNCVFRDNYAWGPGGGIYCGSYMPYVAPSHISVTNCLFYGNHGASGGGISVGIEGTADVVGCVFNSNSANGSGGAVGVYEGMLALRQCTLFANTVLNGIPPDSGGGVAVEFGIADLEKCIIAGSLNGEAVFSENSETNLVCCDLYGNAGGDWVGEIAAQVEINGNFSADPCFCSADLGDFHLCGDSWCLPGNHPWGCDALVGALGAGCSSCECGGPVNTEATTWGNLKAIFR